MKTKGKSRLSSDLCQVPQQFDWPRPFIAWDFNATKKVDFEAQLEALILKATHDCQNDQAWDAVYTCTCCKDVSARDLQSEDG